MFERYTEKARRVIFFARYEASNFGSPQIETEHLLLGLLREDKALASEFLSPNAAGTIRKQIEAYTQKRDKISTSVDLPLSHECKRALDSAMEEADLLKHDHVGTRHLLLGLLREEKCFAATILRERGVDLSQVREKVTAGWDTPLPSTRRERFRNEVSAYLSARERENNRGITVLMEPQVLNHTPDIGVYAGEIGKPARDTPPLICVEFVASTDRLSDVMRRIDDYLGAGVRYVWLLDPATKRAYVATSETGMREVRDAILRTENPALELPLAEIFS